MQPSGCPRPWGGRSAIVSVYRRARDGWRPRRLLTGLPAELRCDVPAFERMLKGSRGVGVGGADGGRGGEPHRLGDGRRIQFHAEGMQPADAFEQHRVGGPAARILGARWIAVGGSGMRAAGLGLVSHGGQPSEQEIGQLLAPLALGSVLASEHEDGAKELVDREAVALLQPGDESRDQIRYRPGRRDFHVEVGADDVPDLLLARNRHREPDAAPQEWGREVAFLVACHHDEREFGALHPTKVDLGRLLTVRVPDGDVRPAVPG